jgi:hypothetical protein
MYFTAYQRRGCMLEFDVNSQRIPAFGQEEGSKSVQKASKVSTTASQWVIKISPKQRQNSVKVA